MTANKLTLTRQAIGLSLIWIGPPIIFFIRDILGLGGSTAFTGLMYFLGCVLLVTAKPLSYFNRVNPLLALLGYSFLGLAFLYFVLFNREGLSFGSDVINFGILFVLIILLFRMDDKIQDYLPVFILLFTLFANFALIYSISTNPNYVIGIRATIQYNTGSTEYSGNPQIFGRNGVIGMIISLLLMIKKQEGLVGANSKFIAITSHFNFILSFVVLVLTQTRGNLISMVGILLFFLFLKPSTKKAREGQSNKGIIRTYYLVLLSAILYLNNRFQIFDKIVMYYDQIIFVVNRAINTGVTLGKAGDNDPSAMGRVDNIEYVQKEFLYKPYNFILGNGFKYKYLDIPILEVWVNFGILGLVIFVLFNIYILFSITKAIRSDSIFQNFIALVYLNVFITLFTSGRPVDTIYWIFYLILIRFINVTNRAEKINL